MAGTSISSQLQAIKSVLNASTDPEPGKKRPLTRPSILFEAKAAADIGLDTILNVALSGLDVLITMDERFSNYKNDLFSFQSKEIDRELVGEEENKKINASIGSYLRLLSGYLELHSALKTLEYLIRRYKVHNYNAEDLILCSLPYHDTHVFVQLVQLIDTGNSRWKFLDGVKASGARLPREVIVQQCIRDMGVLEAISTYATTVKKIQPSKHVTGFCTAVIFEVLGLITVDSDTVKRILPYAGALMIVSLLAQKAALASNVVKSLLHMVASIARAEAKDGANLQWLCMSLMTLISIVQLQSVELIPKKTVNVLSETRDVSEILSGLTKEFNIDKFLSVFLDSLLEHSATDDMCSRTLLSIIETVPMKDYVCNCAQIFEVLGLITVDSDTVKRILPYVSSGLQPGARGLDQKAGALMIVSLLAQKAALASNVVKSLLHMVASIARAEAKDGADLQWLRMSLMTLISIVQLWYLVSKTMAEKAAREFAKEKGIDLVTINPAAVLGPLLRPTLNTSCANVATLIIACIWACNSTLGIHAGAETFMNATYGWTDVRDVANAHILAFENPSANGRYLMVEKAIHFSEFTKILRELYPNYKLPEKWCANDGPYQPTYHVSKERAMSLGVNFTPLEQSIKDTADSLLEKGLLKPTYI